ncbi:unnamed protein product [Parnassius mnemosyne]|uniref:Uncharacterized protein n=1 Tax=Parnassius mnemosyne TaxID=213953 RepID=A0AAV1LLG0_9NEOP
MLQWVIQFLWLSVVLSHKEHLITNCLWHNNTCVDACPEWMVMKKSDCKQAYWIAQQTCEQPEPALIDVSCGFARCDCPEPMVLDTYSGYCYDIDNCPTRHFE